MGRIYLLVEPQLSNNEVALDTAGCGYLSVPVHAQVVLTFSASHLPCSTFLSVDLICQAPCPRWCLQQSLPCLWACSAGLSCLSQSPSKIPHHGPTGWGSCLLQYKSLQLGAWGDGTKGIRHSRFQANQDYTVNPVFQKEGCFWTETR